MQATLDRSFFKILTIGFFSVILVLGPFKLVFATIQWKMLQELKLDDSPKDLAVSPDNRKVYILCQENVFIYSIVLTHSPKVLKGCYLIEFKVVWWHEYVKLLQGKFSILEVILLLKQQFLQNLTLLLQLSLLERLLEFMKPWS